MSARREASQPPVIPGFEYVRLLGMGGFADVFLYRQLMPRRPVAVKVLLASSLDDEARVRFRTEADLMATLSHHPSIVTIHHADVAPDGRPYLVMEYCSRSGLGQRYRAERMGVAEVLRIGVRLASAVETVHRAGILHRDIKPANVLITDFGWPALTDFGIAETTGLAAGVTVGMSIPWSPPELLAEEPTGDVRADVYSLAATVFSLLARRSPFEVAGGSNTAADLIARIERAPLGPTGRGDVPESLQAVLARAMEKDPARRHHSALAFARALQQVEAELMLPLTPLDLPEDDEEQAEARAARTDDSDAGEASAATRVRPVRSVSPDLDDLPPRPTAPGPPSPPAPAVTTTTDTPTTQVAGLEVEHDDVPDVWRRHAAELAAARPEPEPRGRRVGRILVAGVAGAAVVVAVFVGAVIALDPGRNGAPADPQGSASSAPPSLEAVPAPTDLAAAVQADGSVVFTWSNPAPQEGDTYRWAPVTVGSTGTPTVTSDPTATVAPSVTGEDVCIEVSIVRANRWQSQDPAVGCAEQ